MAKLRFLCRTCQHFERTAGTSQGECLNRDDAAPVSERSWCPAWNGFHLLQPMTEPPPHEANL